MLFGITIFVAACGPGDPEDLEPHSELTATEACTARCEVRSTCDPGATNPDASECFDVCMDLDVVGQDSACGEAKREFLACIGALECDDYADAMTPDADHDPCAATRLAFAALECGAMEGSP